MNHVFEDGIHRFGEARFRGIGDVELHLRGSRTFQRAGEVANVVGAASLLEDRLKILPTCVLVERPVG